MPLLRQRELLALIGTLALLSAAACSGPGRATPPPPLAPLECACGSAEADLDGCLCADCRAGSASAVNPLCCCAPLIPAEVPFAGPLEWILPLEGEPRRGWVLERRVGGGVRLLTQEGVSEELAAEELHPRTSYRLAAGAAGPREGAAQLELTRLALALGLLERAREHLRLAGESSPALLPALRELEPAIEAAACERLLQEADASLAQGRAREAARWYALLLLRHPGDETNLPAALGLRRAAEAEGREQEALWPALTPDQGERLAAARAAVERTREYALRGLMGQGSPLRALACFEQALAESERADAELRSLRGFAARDPVLAGAVLWLREQLVREELETLGLQAELCSRLGAHQSARRAALRARHLAPGSGAAARIDGRVERAAAEAPQASPQSASARAIPATLLATERHPEAPTHRTGKPS